MPRRRRPVLGVDYIIDEHRKAQFTRAYLEAQGFCCENRCRFCPYPEGQLHRAEEDGAAEEPAEPATAGRA